MLPKKVSVKEQNGIASIETSVNEAKWYPRFDEVFEHSQLAGPVPDDQVVDYETVAHRGSTALVAPTDGMPLIEHIIDLVNSHCMAQAATLLVDNLQLLFETVSNTELQDFFTTLATASPLPNTDFLYSEALFLIRVDQFVKGIAQLQQAQIAYWHAKQDASAIRCMVDIARAYFNQENFHMAIRYLTVEAKPLLDQSTLIDDSVRADFLLQMANLATETGQLDTSAHYAKHALALYVETENLYGQFRAQLRIARNFMQCGHYPEANARLQLIRQYLHIGKLGPTSEGLLLNAEIHLRWYQYRLDEALRLAHLYLKLADHEQLTYGQLYARILLANLYREKQDYWRADQWYDEAERHLKKVNYHFYQPWVDAQRAWLFILQGGLKVASTYCTRALQTNDWGQRMSFQVEKAVLNLLEGQFKHAEALLKQSLMFYEKSGDPLASSAIRIYLAYAAMQRQDTTGLLHYLQEGFGRMAHLELDVLPYWWHPQLVAEVCCQAIVADVHPTTVKSILVQRIGQQGAPALTKLLTADDIDIREEAQQLLGTVTGQNMTVLAHLEDGPAKQVLQDHLAQGHLRLDGYARLEVELTTAQLRRSPNVTLLAVFVLHTHGVKRAMIAAQLGCSVENVRNYITDRQVI